MGASRDVWVEGGGVDGGARGGCPLWGSRKPCDLSHKHNVQSLVEGCIQLVSIVVVGASWWEMLLHVLHVPTPPLLLVQ